MTVVLNDIDYGPGLVNIHMPGIPNRPTLIVLHGGGWSSGSKDDPWYVDMANQFAALGFAVFNADYSLVGAPSYTPQMPIDDVLTLVAWVRTWAATFNADATRVAILGVSAGAHLGLMAGITGTDGTTRPDAFIGWSTPADLEEAYSQGNGPDAIGVGGYLDVVLSGNETTYRLYSPVDQITVDCCPIRNVGSDTEDTSLATGSGLAVVQFTSLETAAIAAGVPIETRIFVGSRHGIFTGYALPGGHTIGDSDDANDVGASALWLASTLNFPLVFPTTNELDRFERANEFPLSGGGNWPGLVDSDNIALQVLSNQAAPAFNGACNMHWIDTFGPDCEVYATVPTLPGAGKVFLLFLRIADPNTATPDGYLAAFVNAAGGLLQYQRIDNGTGTALGANDAFTWAAGAVLGLRMVGGDLQAYQNGVPIGSGRTDTTYTAAGKIGLGGNDDIWRADNFGGGTIPARLGGSIVTGATEQGIGSETLTLTLAGGAQWISA